MNKFKCRYWNFDREEMIYCNDIFKTRPYTEKSSFSQYESSPKYHDIEIMEHVGNYHGVDLYEYDIVSGIQEGFGIFETYYGLIMYNENEFKYIVIDCDNGVEYDLDDYLGTTIVGNAYQNPELLDNFSGVNINIFKRK